MIIPQLGSGITQFGQNQQNYAFPGLAPVAPNMGDVNGFVGYGYQNNNNLYDPYRGTGLNGDGAAGGLGGAIGNLTKSLGGVGGLINTGIGAVGTLGNLYFAGQANKLARKQFDYTRGVTDLNIANQIQSYNTRLGDIARSRAFTEGQPDTERDRYIRENELRDRRG